MDISSIRQHPLIQGVALCANQQRTVVVANVLAILLLSYSLANITWLLFQQQDEVSQPPPAASQSQAIPHTGKRDWAVEISRYRPFGKREALPQKIGRETTDAPDTRLNLTLRGVIVTGEPPNDRAIVSEGGNPEKAYAIGNQLPGKSTLQEIYADRIILIRNGRMETLRLAKKKPGGASSASSSRSGASSSKGRKNTRANLSLREYRDEFISKPQELANHVRATPVYRDGNMQGIRLRALKDRALLRRHGLRKSDIITAVNGIKIDSEIKGLEILENLRNAEQVDLEISRNGRQRNLALTLDK